jgi:hypothetical protein
MLPYDVEKIAQFFLIFDKNNVSDIPPKPVGTEFSHRATEITERGLF